MCRRVLRKKPIRRGPTLPLSLYPCSLPSACCSYNFYSSLFSLSSLLMSSIYSLPLLSLYLCMLSIYFAIFFNKCIWLCLLYTVSHGQQDCQVFVWSQSLRSGPSDVSRELSFSPLLGQRSVGVFTTASSYYSKQLGVIVAIHSVISIVQAIFTSCTVSCLMFNVCVVCVCRSCPILTLTYSLSCVSSRLRFPTGGSLAPTTETSSEESPSKPVTNLHMYIYAAVVTTAIPVKNNSVLITRLALHSKVCMCVSIVSMSKKL